MVRPSGRVPRVKEDRRTSAHVRRGEQPGSGTPRGVSLSGQPDRNPDEVQQ